MSTPDLYAYTALNQQLTALKDGISKVLAEKDAHIAQLEREVARRDGRISEYLALIATLQHDLEAAEAELELNYQ